MIDFPPKIHPAPLPNLERRAEAFPELMAPRPRWSGNIGPALLPRVDRLSMVGGAHLTSTAYCLLKETCMKSLIVKFMIVGLLAAGFLTFCPLVMPIFELYPPRGSPA